MKFASFLVNNALSRKISANEATLFNSTVLPAVLKSQICVIRGEKAGPHFSI